MKNVRKFSMGSATLAILSLTVSANAAAPGVAQDNAVTNDALRIPGMEELLEMFNPGEQTERDREVISESGGLEPGYIERDREIIPDD